MNLEELLSGLNNTGLSKIANHVVVPGQEAQMPSPVAEQQSAPPEVLQAVAAEAAAAKPEGKPQGSPCCPGYEGIDLDNPGRLMTNKEEVEPKNKQFKAIKKSDKIWIDAETGQGDAMINLQPNLSLDNEYSSKVASKIIEKMKKLAEEKEKEKEPKEDSKEKSEDKSEDKTEDKSEDKAEEKSENKEEDAKDFIKRKLLAKMKGNKE